MASNEATARPDAGAPVAAKPPFGVKITRKTLRHLCARADFLRVQGGGKRFRGQHLVLLVAPAPAPFAAGSRLGLTVSRKVGNAVVRNRVRRVLRAAWQQLLGHAAAGMDHVVIAFPQANGLNLAAAQEELACLLAKADTWASQRGPVTRSLPCTG